MESVLTVTEAANRTGRNPETVRRWIRSGRLRSKKVGARHVIAEQDLASIVNELFPMVPLPREWETLEDGTPAPNWVAALHRSRSGR